MDSQFWINAWETGRTGFHQQNYHEKLLKYFPRFHPREGQKILVPLCGKTRDILWLSGVAHLSVHGVELYDKVVKSFFEENGLQPEVDQGSHFKNYQSKNIKLSSGDFFKLEGREVYDFVYDRASLVALPLEMRKDYAKIIDRVLKKGGHYLLIVYEYDQTKLDGPPFSISNEEVHELYEKSFKIEQMETERPVQEGPRLEALDHFVQKVFILEKK